jgi:hypothetical protein
MPWPLGSEERAKRTEALAVAASKAKNEESVDLIADSNIEMRRNGLLCFTVEQMGTAGACLYIGCYSRLVVLYLKPWSIWILP